MTPTQADQIIRLLRDIKTLLLAAPKQPSWMSETEYRLACSGAQRVALRKGTAATPRGLRSRSERTPDASAP